eukprot:105980-Amphidinium_carterae.1
MFQINADRVARNTSHPIPIGDYMEIKTTFKCTRQRIITDKMVYKTVHFHNLSIITTGEHYDSNYVIEMIKFYYSTEQKEKQPESHLNRFITFMIENQPNDMELMMKRQDAQTMR